MRLRDRIFPRVSLGALEQVHDLTDPRAPRVNAVVTILRRCRTASLLIGSFWVSYHDEVVGVQDYGDHDSIYRRATTLDGQL